MSKNQKPIEQAHDSDLRLSRKALQRAARRAHDLAKKTGTTIVGSHDGVIEYPTPKPIAAPVIVQKPPETHNEGQ